jgi:hypothetical protein
MLLIEIGSSRVGPGRLAVVDTSWISTGLAGSRYHKIPADRGPRWMLALRTHDRPKARFKRGERLLRRANAQGDLHRDETFTA